MDISVSDDTAPRQRRQKKMEDGTSNDAEKHKI